MLLTITGPVWEIKLSGVTAAAWMALSMASFTSALSISSFCSSGTSWFRAAISTVPSEEDSESVSVEIAPMDCSDCPAIDSIACTSA